MIGTRLGVLGVEDARRIARHLEPTQALEAGILTPMAGTRPVRLFSLAEVERFLVVYDGSPVDQDGVWSTVNYVDPANIAKWVAGTLGDADLASALEEIVATRRPYGFLVPEVKALLNERLAQCSELLGEAQSGEDQQ